MWKGGAYRLDNCINQLLGFVNLVLRIRHDKTMEVLLLV